MLTKLVGIVSLLMSCALFAHPVIYKEGKVLSSSNMTSYSDNQALYSFTATTAGGLNQWRFTKDDKNTEFAFARLNHLLKRFNGENSQANIYLLSGVGIVDSEIENRSTNEAYMGGVEMDWETRTFFTALKHYQFSSPKVTDIAMTQARVGFSPAEANFDQLQTWFMVQAMYLGDVDRTVTITPLVRFFYQNVLWEMGSSTRGEWLLNIMVHI